MSAVKTFLIFTCYAYEMAGRQAGPVKSRSIVEYNFAYSYLRFSKCYENENTAIRFSDKISTIPNFSLSQRQTL